ncbi:MAG: TonB-dependent receptor [Pseudolabrys sp.]
MGHFHRVTGAGLALVALLAATAAHAQDNSVTLPTIAVSPTTIPTPIDQLASSVTVITGEEIERDQRRTLPDVLNNVPGVNVVQSGGPGGQAAIFMRGTGSQHVKVLIDGIDASDPSTPNGAVDLAHLLTTNIEQIEVLRGPQGGLYGSNAIGGVISITTKKGSGPAKMTATVEGGSLGTFNQSAGVSGSSGQFNYTFDVSHFRAASIPVTPLYYLPPGQQRNNDYYDNMTYATRLGFDANENLSFNFYGRFTDSTLRFTNDSFNFILLSLAPNPDQSFQQAQAAYGRVETVWKLLDGRFVNTFGVNVTDYKRSTQDPNVSPESRYNGTRTKFDWRGNFAVTPEQMLVMGLEREDERAGSSSLGTFPAGPISFNANSGNQAAYLELQSKFAERFFLVSNIRVDDNDQFGSHFTWRVAPAFLVPVTDTKLKASYGTGFKAPTLYELYGVGDFNFIGNPLLKPETSTGYEYGFEQPIANDRFRFGATYFHSDITDLINGVFVPANTYVNIGKALIHGYETFAEAKVTERLRVRGDYTQTVATDATTGAELQRRPRDKLTGTVVWSVSEALTLSTNVIYVGTWKDFDRAGNLLAPADAPGYTVVNLAANYVVDKNVTVFGRIDNLFNKQYEDPTGWMHPGFGVFGGVKLTSN